MLALGIQKGSGVVIRVPPGPAREIKVGVISAGEFGGKTRLSFDADREVEILRSEVAARHDEELASIQAGP